MAQAWAEKLAADGSLQHNPDFATQLWNAVGSGAVAENIGHISPADPAAMHQRFLASPNHRANIVGSFTYVGIGAAKDADGMLLGRAQLRRAQLMTHRLAPSCFAVRTSRS